MTNENVRIVFNVLLPYNNGGTVIDAMLVELYKLARRN